MTAPDLSYEGLLRTLGETAADLQETRLALERSREKAAEADAARDAAVARADRAEADAKRLLHVLETVEYNRGGLPGEVVEGVRAALKGEPLPEAFTALYGSGEP